MINVNSEANEDLLSVIVSCYNEQDCICDFYKEINAQSKIMSDTNFEFIFIDDGSDDKTLDIIKELVLQDQRVKYISFSRNFGKEAAILAGLEFSLGQYVAVMDADLQDPPSLLAQMLSILQTEPYDCVGTKRVTRSGEPVIRSWLASLFYSLMAKMSKVQIVDGARDFRLMRRSMVDAIIKLREVNRFSKGIFAWVGFKTKYLEYENVERKKGETKWSFWKLFTYSLEGIVSFSTVPLAISSFFGIILCMASFALILYFIIQKVSGNIDVGGYAAMMCVILFLGGIQLLCIGILGQYLAKVFTEVKNRPIYVIREQSHDK